MKRIWSSLEMWNRIVLLYLLFLLLALFVVCVINIEPGELLLAKAESGATIEIEPRYGFKEDEIFILVQLLSGDKNVDGDGEYDIDFKNPDDLNYGEINKVLCVVMNRQRDGRFPKTVKEIVLAKNQFSVFPRNLKAEPSELALSVVRGWCQAYDCYEKRIQTIPENHVYFTGDGVINRTRP
jgi:hypothetical protein